MTVPTGMAVVSAVNVPSALIVKTVIDCGITDIAIEGPLPLEAIRHRARPEPEAVSRMLRGMIGIAEEIAGTHCGGRYHEYTAQEVKKYFTGNRLADKAAMVARAKLFGWNPPDDNSADAGAVWSLCMSRLDPRFGPMATPLFSRAR